MMKKDAMPSRELRPVVTRFAPSPTGHLHLGHAYSALFAQKIARETGGRMLLRIEDIDKTRCRPEFETAIFQDLEWLGLEWETPVRRQSDYMSDYQDALDSMDELGLLYPCFCTRREIAAEAQRSGQAPHAPDELVYPGICRTLSSAARKAKLGQSKEVAVRLDMEKALSMAEPLFFADAEKGEIQATPSVFGDVVLGRKDIKTSYHLAVTLDDHIQGVNLVTRGEDLFSATHVHRLIQEILGLDVPDYHHHRLLVGADGVRFSKRDKSLTLRALKAAGKTPEDVRRMAGF
jgi:glutamyl-Q tRNA(Asp) synthetase